MRGVKHHSAGFVLSDAVNALSAIETEGISLDDVLDSRLAHPELRRTVSSLLFQYFRRKRFIDTWIARLASRPPRPPIRRVLAVALTQLRFQTGIAPQSAANIAVDFVKESGWYPESRFVNAVLRNAPASMPVLSDEPGEVLPPLLLRRWNARFRPDELEALTEAFLTPAGFTFRAEREFVPGELASAGVPAYGRFRFYFSDDPGRVLGSEALREGNIYIQDPAASLAPSLPDFTGVRRILDLCAAPGGKSLMLAEQMEPGATLVAADRSERRQQLTADNFRRRGLDFAILTAEPHEVSGTFDLVLADVPCSNTGVFRRRPDALWRFSAGELARILRLQEEILNAAADRVAPGGQLVYSTCSIELEENGLQIERFLSGHPEFRKVTARQILPSVETDGAYACLLRRD